MGKIYIVLNGYGEDYSEYGTLATDEFVGAACTKEAASSMAELKAKEEYEKSETGRMYVASNHDSIIPDGAYVVEKSNETFWYYVKEYEMEEQ